MSQYYVEQYRPDKNFMDPPEKIWFPPETTAEEVLRKFKTAVMNSPCSGFVLRVWNGWLHGLIAEVSRGDMEIFWYWTYPEYKKFAEALGYEPHKEGE